MKLGLWRSTDGATAVEFALILLPFLLFVFGIVEFGRAYYERSSLERTADRMERYIMIAYRNKNVSKVNMERDLRNWVTLNYKLGDSNLVSVDAQIGFRNGYPFRQFSLQKQIYLSIPIVNPTIDISVTRTVPY